MTGDATGLEEALTRALDGEVAFDAYTRHLFSRDASMYAITPAGVVYPRHAGDVATALRLAGEAGLPVLARGAGTSLAGQTVGPGLVLDLSRHMHAIRSIDREARTALVEPGVVQDDLNGAAAPHGLMFGPDTSTSNRATIGGMIGNNSAGSGSLRYGMTIDHVQQLEVVLSDGSTATLGVVDEAERQHRAAGPGLLAAIHRELPRLVEANADAIATGFPSFWRRAGGYRLDRLAPGSPFDLAKFVVGSEGTLAIVIAATVGLVPKPSRTVFAVGHFAAVQDAINATGDALRCEPAQVELLDRTILDLSRQKIEYAGLGQILRGDPDALLFVSFTGDDEQELVAAARPPSGGGKRRQRLPHLRSSRRNSRALWSRSAGFGPRLHEASSEGTRRPLAFVEDTAVDPRHLAEYTGRYHEVHRPARSRRASTATARWAACSQSFVELTRHRPGGDDAGRRRRDQDLVREYGGANSSQHGDGLARSEFNRGLFGDDLYEAMRQVKGLFDPFGRLNPGKIVDSPSMLEHLRDVELPEPDCSPTRLRFDIAVNVRAAPMHEHRPVPQVDDRHDVSLVYRDPAGGALHCAAGPVRWCQGAQRRRSPPRAGRRTLARGAGSLPDVQGVQE